MKHALITVAKATLGQNLVAVLLEQNNAQLFRNQQMKERDAQNGAKPTPAHSLLVSLNFRLPFDVKNTTEALKRTGVEPPVTDYRFCRRQVRYAIAAGYLA